MGNSDPDEDSDDANRQANADQNIPGGMTGLDSSDRFETLQFGVGVARFGQAMAGFMTEDKAGVSRVVYPAAKFAASPPTEFDSGIG